MRAKLFAYASVVVLALAPTVASAQPTPTPVQCTADGASTLCGEDNLQNIACLTKNDPAYIRARSVAIIWKTSPFKGHCTGFLVTDGSSRNKMLTNAHCISSQAELDSALIRFDYQNECCDCAATECASCYRDGVQICYRGGTLLFTDPKIKDDWPFFGLDVSLFTVQGDPASTHGQIPIDASGTERDQSLYTIGHPGVTRDAHKVIDASPACKVSGLLDLDFCGLADVNGLLHTCDVEDGSSGAPLIDSRTHKVVGLNWGGCCSSLFGNANAGSDMKDVLPAIQPYLGCDCDNDPACERGCGESISGEVTYYSSGSLVPRVEMMPGGGGAPWSEGTGQFVYDAVAGSSATLVPRKLGDRSSAVSALDATYILQISAGLRQFNNLQSLACDVTGNGWVSALDAARVLQRVAGLRASFPVSEACGSDWVFFPDAEAAPDQTRRGPIIWSGSCQPASITYDPVGQTLTGQNFLAAVFGDCTGNWTPPLPAEVGGVWVGSWSSKSGIGGALSFSLVQDESMVDGTASIDGSPCFPGGSLSGVVSGGGLSGSLRRDGVRVNIDGMVSNRQMTGRYYVAVGSCAGDQGTLAATLQP